MTDSETLGISVFDLRSARYFVAVAEELHFGRAAERLHMSQPPLSQAIRRLEKDVGAALFERTHRKVALTPAGEAFLAACRPLLEQAANVAEIPRLAAEGHSVRLTIGAVASALTWPLPHALTRLREQSPEVSVSIEEIDTDEVVGRLGDGSIDVALARLAASRAGVRTRILLREEFIVIAPADHPAATGSAPILLSALAPEPWVWIAREVSPDYHDDMASAFRSAGFAPRRAHTARSIASQIAIVAGGNGMSIIPRSASGDLPQGVVSREIAGAGQIVTLAVSTREPSGPHEESLLKHVQDVIEAGTAGPERIRRSPPAVGPRSGAPPGSGTEDRQR